MLPLDTSALSSALQGLDVKQEVIDQVVGVLTSTSDEMGDGQFATRAEIPPAAFGQRPTAQQLGVHHGKAHVVMQQVVDELAADLVSFATGAKTAIGYINQADDTSGADLAAVQAAVEQMNQAAERPDGPPVAPTTPVTPVPPTPLTPAAPATTPATTPTTPTTPEG